MGSFSFAFPEGEYSDIKSSFKILRSHLSSPRECEQLRGANKAQRISQGKHRGRLTAPFQWSFPLVLVTCSESHGQHIACSLSSHS